jgi:hypothetical protein
MVCGYGFRLLDFSHYGGQFVHLDTGDPWDSPLGAIAHLFVDVYLVVDVYLGNGFYEVIPRPWP